MATETIREEKREKLKGVENWHSWSNLTQLILGEKGYWDIVTGDRTGGGTATLQASFRKEEYGAARIIKEGLSSAMFKTVEDTNVPSEIWNTLKATCTLIGQGVLYSGLTSLLTHPSISKAAGHGLSIAERFGEVNSLIKKIQAAVEPGRNIWQDIALITILEGLPEEYNAKKEHILNQKHITPADAQQILASEESRVVTNRQTNSVPDRALTVVRGPFTRKPMSEIDCRACGKYGHFARDCHNPRSDSPRMNQKRRGTTSHEANRAPKHRAQKVVEYNSDEDSGGEPHTQGRGHINMVLDIKPNSYDWYIDSGASSHITNQRHLFVSLEPHRQAFSVANGKTILSTDKGTIELQTSTRELIRIENVVYVPKCDSNLLSLGQLRQSGITYHDDNHEMTLRRDGKTIARALRVGNLYILDTTRTGMTLTVNDRGRPTYLCGPTAELDLWHRRFAHAGVVRIKQASQMTTGLNLNPSTKTSLDDSDSQTETSSEPPASEQREEDKPSALSYEAGPAICEPCVASKQTRIVHHEPMRPTTRLLERVHSDLWGPHDPPSFADSSYGAILIDDWSRKSWILFLKTKDQFFDKFKMWKTQVENESGSKLVHLRIDGGGEFVSQTLRDYCADQGTSLEYSVPYTPEHNAISERSWRTLRTMKDAMLLDSKLPNQFWAEAMDTANYIRNRLPTHARAKTPEEGWTGITPDVSHIRIFGSVSYVHIPKEKRIKSDLNRTWKGILIGYTETNKHVKVWSVKTNSVHIVSAYTIDETCRGSDLLQSLPAPIRTKISNRIAPDAPRKRGRPRLVVNNEAPEPQDFRTNRNTNSQLDKEAEEDMPAPPHKRGRPQKSPLSVDSPPRRLIETRQDAQAADDSSEGECIVVDCGRLRSQVGAGVAETLDASDQSAIKKLSMRASRNKQGPYEASAGVRETLDAQLMDAGVVKAPNAEWMSTAEPGKMASAIHAENKTCESIQIREPHSYEDAVGDPVYGRQWREAIEDELTNLRLYSVWIIEPLPEGRRPVGCKWVFKIKYDENGRVSRFKARLVAQGFSQIYGVDYQETFAPTVRRESLRMFLAMVASYDMELHQMDVKAAYLAGELESEGEKIYMRIPEGVTVRQPAGVKMVCRIVKGLYGLKQSARLWHKKLIGLMTEHEFQALNADPSILVRRNSQSQSPTIVSVYVDDLLIASTSIEDVDRTKQMLDKAFKMSDLGEARTIIGLRITRNRNKRTLTLDQASYIEEVLSQEGMRDCSPVEVPMKPGSYITLDETDDDVEANLKDLQRIVGKLMYIACGTRPDIAFAVGCLSQNITDPRLGHMKAAKRIMRYLKGTIGLGLMYGTTGLVRTNQFSNTAYGYADSNYAGDLRDRRSTMGYAFMLNGGIVAWMSKKQRTVSTSTTEAEYIALGHGARQGVWMRRFINELGLDKPTPHITLLGDNESSISLAQNAEQHSRTKHIDIQHHYLRAMVEDRELVVEWVPTKDMLADGLTKALTKDQFRCHRSQLGLVRLWGSKDTGGV